MNLNDIINTSNDSVPKLSDDNWTPVPNKNFYIMNGSKHYTISDKLIKLMNKYTSIYRDADKAITIKTNQHVSTIFLLENDLTNERYVGYTSAPMQSFIKFNINKYNLDKENVFDNLDRATLDDFSFETIEFVKDGTRNDVLERKKIYHDLFVNKPNDKAIGGAKEKPNKEKSNKNIDFLDKIYDKRMDMFFEILGPQVSKFKSFVGYIYLLTNTITNKIFISGYHKKLNKRDFIEIIEQNSNANLIKDLKKYGRRNFDITVIDKYDAKTHFDFLLRIDFFKLKYKSTKNGYNQGFSLSESESLFSQRLLTRKKRIMTRNIFLKIQKCLFEKNFVDNNQYDNLYGFVYQIQHKKTKMRYFAYAHINQLKNIIIGLYNEALEGNVKHNKILKAFEEEMYDSFTFKIMKKKKMDDHKTGLEDETDSLILRYDTINIGYNLDNKQLQKNIRKSKKSKKSKKI
jgi:hypothetical protein